MPRRYFKFIAKRPELMQSSGFTRVFGNALSAYDLWHINRRSVSLAFFNGLFCAFIPIPAQMLLAAAGAVAFRCNFPLSVSLVWVSNPITMPAIFYANYIFGALLLRQDTIAIDQNLTFELITDRLNTIWLPLVIGSVTAATLVGGVSYLLVSLFWRLEVMRNWQQRKSRSRPR